MECFKAKLKDLYLLCEALALFLQVEDHCTSIWI